MTIADRFADCEDTVDVLAKLARTLDPKGNEPPSTGELNHRRAAAWLVHAAGALHRAADVLLVPENDPLDEMLAHLHALLSKLVVPELARRQKELADLPEELLKLKVAADVVKLVKRATDALGRAWRQREELRQELADIEAGAF